MSKEIEEVEKKEMLSEEAVEVELEALGEDENALEASKEAESFNIDSEDISEQISFSEVEDTKELDFSDVEDCAFSLDLRKKVIEAVLFSSGKPLSLSTLMAAFGQTEKGALLISKTHLEEALTSFKEDLVEEDRGFRLCQVNGGYQLRTAENMKDYLQNTIKARTFRLTGPSLEVLAMVAYKQPCTKSQVDEVRGVESSHLMRALMDKGLVAFAGKSELPGKPMLYKTTPKFLETFGLRNLRELPSLSEIEALLPDGISESEEDEKESETLAELAGKLSENFEGSYSAGEEELGKITNQLSDISTSSEFFEQEKQREKDRKELEKAESIREALMVEEDVSERDKKWLVRYDEKLKSLEEENKEELQEVEDEGLSVSSIEEVAEGVESLKPLENLEDVVSEFITQEDLDADSEEEIVLAESLDEVAGGSGEEEDFEEGAGSKILQDLDL